MSDTQPTKKAAVLAPDNFTPPRRTPWGGRRITERYKAHLGIPPTQVGESWELSVEPDFPSHLRDGRPLAEVIDAEPEAWVGPGRASTSLLVKLLDAASPLSVQIHPADDDPHLAPGESGKPESWYVLDADEGAGLYLGLEEGVDEAAMRAAIEGREDVSKLLTFVPVRPGDFFVIDAGTPHAIGPGLTLVEPQRVAPGSRGLTYRYWDWNRTYDPEGKPDPDGSPRTLHVDEALRVTRWDLPRGAALLERIRVRAGPAGLEAPPLQRELTAEVESEHLGASRLCGTGKVVLDPAPRLRALTVVDGTVTIDDVVVSAGETAALPAALPESWVTLDRAHALLSWVVSAPREAGI